MRRAVHSAADRLRSDPALGALLAGACLLMLPGLGWGLPNVESWSNDAIAPWLPLRVPRTYFLGSDKYPYLHSWISLVLYAPYLVWLLATGGLDLGCYPSIRPECFSAPHRQLGALIAISRGLSVAMALATLAGVYALARRVWRDRAAARWAAASAAVGAGLVYYAHVSNLDVPQLCWFVWSLWALVGVVDRGALRDYAAFGVLAGLAVGTKEGILGAYVGAGAAVLWVHVRRAGPGALVDRRMLALVGGVVGVYVLATNPILNWSGFVDHWREWLPTGERMTGYAQEFTGYGALLAELVGQLDDAMGPGPLALGCAGVVWAAWRRPRALVLLLPAATFFAFSVAPARFAPLRFALPWTLVLAVFAGGAAARLRAARGPAAWAGTALLALALGHAALQALAVDQTFRRDTRYRAEAWLEAHVPRGAAVGALGHARYLPRLGWLGYELRPVPLEEQGAEALRRAEVDWLVLSSFYFPRLLRYEPGGAGAIVESLLADERKDADALPGAPEAALDWEVAFDEHVHPPLARWLGRAPEYLKANPRILVLRRASGNPSADPSAGE